MSRKKGPQTLRQALQAFLQRSEAPVSLREMAASFGISEKEVAGHLEHIRKSLRDSGSHLEITPAECGKCGFVFAKRDRFSSPGRCPLCKGEYILPAQFGIGNPSSSSFPDSSSPDD